MARKPRVHYPGAWYHVILRGNGGQDVFFSDTDRLRFFGLLADGIEKYHHSIHCYCLMTNHVHLLVQVGGTPLSKIIHNLSFRYTRYINDRLGRTGHLFQGRYMAILVDADTYLLQLVRYIHSNPVRAGFAGSPGDYRWSSHQSYSGERTVPWLATDRVLGLFSPVHPRAIELYREFMGLAGSAFLAEKTENENKHIHILGEGEFADNVLSECFHQNSSRLDLDELLAGVCSFYSVTFEELSSNCRKREIVEARSAAAYLIREAESFTLADLGKKLNRESSSLSHAAARFEQKARQNNTLSATLLRLKKHLGSGLQN